MRSSYVFFYAVAQVASLIGMPTYAQQAAPPPAVLVQLAELRSMTKQAEFVGRAEALEKVDLRARVQGFLGARLFKDGDEVKEGQVVFTIEREPFEAAVDQRKAQLAAAQAKFANADQQLQRTAELARKGNAPIAQLDQRTAEQGQAKAAVLEAEANLRDAQIQLSYTEIKTPISGRIGRAAVSPGNLVGPDSGVLATVVQDNPMQVLFSVTQREMIEARDSEVTGKVRARVRLADGSLYTEKGRIDFLDVQVNPRTDGQIVRAMFPNPDDILTSGQTVRVIIEEKGGDKVVIIPYSGVAIDQTGSYVFVVGQDNKVEQRRVRIGTIREGLAVVDEGVQPGERVVVQGQQRIRAGMTVAPQPAPTPAG
ncbi:MAG: efflux RND transporter periplasmic adaptor subunit [Alphaproteobacteria bacterium]|nr:MAG: efflux RND transporter periplasmic adaptor subunit [Alphaproteobacteria bacterium]